MSISTATSADITTINALYNYYVQATYITFDVDIWSDNKRLEWFSKFANSPYELLVAKEQNRVTGFAYTSQFRPKAAYGRSAELTIYTCPETALAGTGSALYQALIDQAKPHFHRLYAMIALPNDKSLALHRKFGFVTAGHLNDAGYKFGRYHSIEIVEKQL